jgi:hypothetical protein
VFVFSVAAWRAIASTTPRMGVTDDRDVVVRVEVSAPIRRLHPGAVAADEVERRPIRQRLERAAEDAVATGQQSVRTAPVARSELGR